MHPFDPHAYGLVFAPLLETDRHRPLDDGQPESDARSALKKLSVESAFAHVLVMDRDMAACCISGVWLLHDYLEESHKISQDIDTTTGSYWHAIMHRREGDFSNSKYWFRRVGQHPVFVSLVEPAAALAAERNDESLIRKLIANRDWDPYAFVDACQSVVRGQNTALELCLDIQQAEWELLFDHCYHEAIGK